MAKKKKARISLDQSDGFGGSLGAQLGLTVPASTETSAPAVPEPTQDLSEGSPSYRIELRVSRKGYGGKTVTECSGIEVEDKATKSAFSRSLSTTFGVRVFWKEEICCVQGDQVDRLLPYFRAEGHEVRAVSR